jgi:hypothetical protein
MSIVDDDNFQISMLLVDYIDAIKDTDQHHRLPYLCDEIERRLEIIKKKQSTRKIKYA